MRPIDFLTERCKHLEQNDFLYRCKLAPFETGLAKGPCFGRHKTHCPKAWEETKRQGKEKP